MSRVVLDGDRLVSHLLNFPDDVEKLVFQSRPQEAAGESKGGAGIPADILETPKEYVFCFDVPGLSKSDIQVTVEDDQKSLVIRSNGKRKREDTEEEEACKYVRLERRAPRNQTRKFRLPDNADPSAISAKCENGVLTVTVKKLPAPKPKTVEVAIN
ncbi:SHSP domain-containing protein [Psidium guajava]|nr:SHSP domain-containing protein [Psidium guajava]